jgi:P4 family phage/plasmid primase-like protien
MELAFGQYTAKVPVTLLTQKKGASGSASPEVARLKGKRLVSTQEPEENEKFNIGLMKELTGGDRIFCRGLYQDPFDFKPQFKMLFCCNHLPSLPPDDDGTWRRVSLVEFLSRFVAQPDPNNRFEFQRDNYLSDKLQDWREAFMFILLEHYKLYKKHGIKEPKAVCEATQSYRRDNDTVLDFMNDCIRQDPDSSVKIDEVFRRFKEWHRDNCTGKLPQRKQLKSSLEKKMGRYKKEWKGYAMIDEFGSDTDETNIIAQGILTPS